jgi:spermidine dehydrogenase
MKHRRTGKPDLGMDAPITRRDFVNGVLAGSGAALLWGGGPAFADTLDPYAPSGSPWTGFGGVGDYRWANGNTEAAMNAAHGIRDGAYADASGDAAEESADLVIVGGGFSGMTAAYEFNKRRKPGQTCLLLENHAMFGGEARQNEFEVDGRRLTAPQGSNAGLVVKPTDQISGRYGTYADYYRELEMPSHYEFEALADGAEKYHLANDHFDPMIMERKFAAGYFFPGTGWARDPVAAGFANTPWPANVQKDLADFVGNRRDQVSGQAEPDRWLDGMSYHGLLDRLGYGAEVKRYVDPLLGVGNFGVCGNAISAYGAKRLTLPGTIASTESSRFSNVEGISFPGGNAAIIRRLVARMIPGAIAGDGSLKATTTGAVDFAQLDRSGAPLRIRLESTAVRVRHDGDPGFAESVIVTYARHGKLHNVRAKAVVLGSGGWVNRRIVADLPAAHAEAYANFRYGPVLTANVAVRHWRYFDTLGFTVARWFSGLGWQVCVRRNAVFDMNAPSLTPDSPIVLTFYIPFLDPDVEPAFQGNVARARLLAPSYAEFERKIREQMTEMFGTAGFDARRDIAGIVLNRWGHAYFAPPVGFFFGKDGGPPPHEVVRRPHGRIVFAHSELQGNMNMAHAMLEGKRGALEALELIGTKGTQS